MIGSVSALSAWLRYTLVLTLLLTAVFLLQQYLIMPLELHLSQSSIAAIASLVFIPHGAKVLLATLSGYRSIVPILTAQFIGGLSFDLTPVDALTAAAIATSAVILPLWLLRNAKALQPNPSNINLFWAMLFIGAASSVLNSLFISLYRDFAINGISLRFFIGDLMGTVIIFALIISFRKLLIKVSLKGIQRSLKRSRG